MKYSMILVVVSMMIGCGKDNVATGPDILIGVSNITEEQVRAIIDTTNTFTPNGKKIDLSTYTITVLGTQEELDAACPPGDDGCMWPNKIYVLFKDHESLSWAGFVLGHELGHAYYKQYGQGPDGGHTHTEWFDKYDHDSVENKVAGSFVVH